MLDLPGTHEQRQLVAELRKASLNDFNHPILPLLGLSRIRRQHAAFAQHDNSEKHRGSAYEKYTQTTYKTCSSWLYGKRLFRRLAAQQAAEDQRFAFIPRSPLHAANTHTQASAAPYNS